jgi:predicted transcriptional regulator
MLSDFRTLAPTQTVGDAARWLLAGSQQDFPIVDRGRVVGVLAHQRLFEALREREETAPIAELMDDEFQVADADEPLDQVMSRLEPGGCTTLPVLVRGELVGLLTAENVGEFFMIRRALANRPPPPPRVPPAMAVPPVIADLYTSRNRAT